MRSIESVFTSLRFMVSKKRQSKKQNSFRVGVLSITIFTSLHQSIQNLCVTSWDAFFVENQSLFKNYSEFIKTFLPFTKSPSLLWRVSGIISIKSGRTTELKDCQRSQRNRTTCSCGVFHYFLMFSCPSISALSVLVYRKRHLVMSTLLRKDNFSIYCCNSNSNNSSSNSVLLSICLPPLNCLSRSDTILFPNACSYITLQLIDTDLSLFYDPVSIIHLFKGINIRIKLMIAFR